MGQHPPGFTTRSVSARAGKGSDQEGVIHRLILMQCVSGGNLRREGNKNAMHSPPLSWRLGRAGVAL